MEGLEYVSYMCRNYVDTQQLRIAEQHRLYKLYEMAEKKGEEPPEDIVNVLKARISVLKSEEETIVKEVKRIISDLELFRFCTRVKGLGVVSAMEFLGYVDIRKATSAGKVKAFAGLVPGRKFVKGQKASFNPEVKGRFWLFARNVIMHKDDYYYPLYLAKKEYYLKKRGFEKFAEEPELCPRYEECRRKLEAKAARMGRKPKKPACRAHADGMAKMWLASLIVSHMWEITRKEFNLPVSKHRMHIPPKPEDPEHAKAVLDVVVPYLREGVVVEGIDLSDRKVATKLSRK